MQPGADCFVGIDLGTSGCRAIAIDAHAQTVAEAREPLPGSARPAPGASEQDPQAWWRAVERVLRALTAQQPGRIRALSVDGTSSTLLLCDDRGAPVTPALMYDDSRAQAAAETIARTAPPDSPARGAGSALAKLLHLLPAHAGGTPVHAVHQADWVIGRLGAGFGISDENNALKLGYDVQQRCWPAWIDALALPAGVLPDVRPVGSVLGSIDTGVATALGLPADTLLVAGTTDSNAATLAAGIRDPGDAVTSLGSTLVLKICSPRPVAASRYGVYSHRLGERWLAGGASNTGGAVLRRYFSDAAIAELSTRIDPSHPLGLNYYPLPGPGERFPHNDPQYPPRMTPRPALAHEFLQAILEGIADIEAEGYRRLTELGAPAPRRVFSVGGGAVNETWRLIRERRLGVPVIRAAHTEAAYGTALIARDAALA